MTMIAVTGANGRMGRALIKRCHENPLTFLSSAVVRGDSGLVGLDVGELVGVGQIDVELSEDLDQDSTDVVIDFTHPEISMTYVDWCAQHDKTIVIGTTGFNAVQKQKIQQAAEKIAIVLAPNMSIGVNLSFHLAEVAARALGDSSDIEIIEAHHRNKVDAPSGTALALGEKMARAVNRDLEEVAVYGRQGQTGVRSQKAIGFSTVRGGDIIGEHTVMFAGDGERLEITHRSSTRNNFANGAIRAALWLSNQNPGLFDMQDVLGFDSQ